MPEDAPVIKATPFEMLILGLLTETPPQAAMRKIAMTSSTLEIFLGFV